MCLCILKVVLLNDLRRQIVHLSACHNIDIHLFIPKNNHFYDHSQIFLSKYKAILSPTEFQYLFHAFCFQKAHQSRMIA